MQYKWYAVFETQLTVPHQYIKKKKSKPHIHIYINPYKCVYYTLNNDVMAHCIHGSENVTVAPFSIFLLSNASLKPVEMFFSENLLKYSRIGLIQTWMLYSSVTYLKRLDCVCTICGFAQLRPKAISHRHISGTSYLPEPHAVLQLSEKPVVLHCLWTTVRHRPGMWAHRSCPWRDHRRCTVRHRNFLQPFEYLSKPLLIFCLSTFT